MDEFQLCSLITEGENEALEFKRELRLETQEEKAEFVKDVIALANSTSEIGRLLVGVADDRLMVGSDEPQLERLQQLLDTYTSPPILLNCEMVPMSHPNLVSVAVISVRAIRKPHMVARAVGRLAKDDVYVRHGRVVAKASPDEIVRMHEDETLVLREARQFTKAGEKHMGLKNWQSAVEAFSKAIESCPTADLFYKRGRAYEQLSVESEKPATVTWEQWPDHPLNPQKLAALADKSYSDAIESNPPAEIEKQARLGRVRVAIRPWDDWMGDVGWLQDHTTGRARGEVLYWEVHRWEAIPEESVAPDAIAKLTEALQLGFLEPDVYHLRARAQLGLCNYGLALQDIDEAIAKGEPRCGDGQSEYLWLKAEILASTGRLRDAHKFLLGVRNKLGTTREAGRFFVDYDLEKDIVLRFALAYDLDRKPLPQHRRMMLAMLVHDLARAQSFWAFLDDAKARKTVLDELEREQPGIRRLIGSMLGKETWQACLDECTAVRLTFER